MYNVIILLVDGHTWVPSLDDVMVERRYMLNRDHSILLLQWSLLYSMINKSTS